MDTKRICSICGKPLAPSAPEGLCPECLLKAGLGTGVDIGPDTGGKAPRFTPPKIEELAAKFPQLEILEFIGQGGMGAVYKARQKQLERVVALKILPPQAGGPAFAERFTREARALAKLNHPHIITLYEFGQSDGLFYFLMEFVDGVNLRQLLSNSRVSPREALAIVPQICEALQFAHDSGIVHRDIKPENILLDKKGLVKIADFGVAKMIAESLTEAAEKSTSASGELTEAGSTLGTPQYMAPEQIKNSAEVDHRADIYSLGVVFYQMLTGELPSGKIEPPSRKVQIDVRLDEVVLRALEKKPELRFQQASDVKTAVETIATAPLTQAPETLPGFKHYKDSQWNFELDIPESWNTLPPDHKNSPLEVLRFASNAGRHLLIIFRTPSYYFSPKDASDWAQKQLAKAGFGNFVSAETTVGGQPVRTLDFDRPEGDGTWSCRHYFIAGHTKDFTVVRVPTPQEEQQRSQGRFGYTLGFGTTDKAGMFETFDRIAKSFQFQPSGDENALKPFFPKTETVAADEPKQKPGGQKAEPELHKEGYTVRVEPVNPPKPVRRFGMGSVIAFLVIILAAIAILISVRRAAVNASPRTASLVRIPFHFRVFEADADLVDHLIPSPGFRIIIHHADTESQIAPISPAVVHRLLQNMATVPGLLVDQTCLVSNVSQTNTADSWHYHINDASLFGGGVGNASFGVRKENGATQARIDGWLYHGIDNAGPGLHFSLNSQFLYEGPLPQTNELVFLTPFVRQDGSEHYLLTLFDFNGLANEESPSLSLNKPPFTAQLHQATVELAAVGDEPWTNPICWYPNGRPSPKAFPTGQQNIISTPNEMNLKKLVFYVRNQSTNDVSMPICRVDDDWPPNASSTWVPPYEFNHRGYFGLSLGVPTNATTANLSIGVANGPWETVVSLDHSPHIVSSQGTGDDNWRGTYESVAGQNGDVAVSCSYTTGSNCVSRIVYVNDNGKIVPISERSTDAFGSTSATGTLLISSNEYAHIKQFLVQRRKFQWVDFDNISLQQGHPTSVTAKVY